jgi:predicted GH43/DUF377 family glycosyl hydrolase
LYSAWNHENVHLSAATSTDLVNWTKHGPVLAKAHGGRFHHTWTKAGAIVTELVEGRLIAAKIDGRYWMYFGEGDVYVATSDDLIDWNPLLDGDGNLLAMFSTRDGKFDSTLCEPGPPALLTEDGIVLLYNGRNDEVVGDPSLPAGIYCAGQALFDSHSPDRLVARTTEPWFKPSSGYETTGQYVQGTVFIEGLVYFEDRWFLYYGTADSHVAVAIWDPSYSESHQKTKPDRSESKK